MSERPPFRVRIVPIEDRARSALELFRMGFDTRDISYSKGVSEAAVYNWIATSREAERQKIA